MENSIIEASKKVTEFLLESRKTAIILSEKTKIEAEANKVSEESVLEAKNIVNNLVEFLQKISDNILSNETQK